MQVIIVLAAFLAAVSAFEWCPKLSTVQDFDISNITGTWFQHSSNNGKFFQYAGDCVKVDIQLEDDTSAATVTYREKFAGNWIEVSGNMTTVVDDQKDGHVTQTLVTESYLQATDLSILAADYDKYMVMWSCSQFWGSPIQSGWVFTRQPEVDFSTMMEINNILVKIATEGGPSSTLYQATSQKQC